MMNIYKFTDDFVIISVIVNFILVFLLLMTIYMVEGLIHLPNQLIITEQVSLKDNLCEFKIVAPDQNFYKIKDNCNKYKIGDKLILIKEIK